MVDSENTFSDEVTRVPTRDDLVKICSALNQRACRYIVVGGAAIIEAGLLRTTHDVDLLVDSSPDNVRAICEALEVLPEKAARDVRPEDVQDYVVVRINDEFTIDLMGSACGLDYEAAFPLVDVKSFNGVSIPFASPQLLWKTKQTHREKKSPSTAPSFANGSPSMAWSRRRPVRGERQPNCIKHRK